MATESTNVIDEYSLFFSVDSVAIEYDQDLLNRPSLHPALAS
jgi:hypothetical protein